jgi:hypothetical protein
VKYTPLLIALLAGCSVGEEQTTNAPNGWKKFIAPGGYTTYVFPTVLEDGTRCAVAIGNSSGRAISCDWKEPAK